MRKLLDQMNMDIADVVGGTISIVCVLGMFYVMMIFGTAYENHARCENGAIEYCEVAK